MNKYFLSPLAQASRRVSGVTFLFRDDFTTNESAPVATPRNAEPGPGVLTFTQNDGQFSIAASSLHFPPQSTPAWGALGFVSEEISRASGNALVYTIDLSTTAGTLVGVRNNADVTFANFASAVLFNSATNTRFREGLSNNIALGDVGVTSGLELTVCNITRSVGSFLVRKIGSGDWELLYVGVTDSSSSHYIFGTNFGGEGDIDKFRFSLLGAPWDTDYGIATERLAGARTAGDTFTHEADALIEFGVTTLPTVSEIALWFRKQDDNNLWEIRVFPNGVLRLRELVGGVYTGRINTGSGTVSSGDRIILAADDETIKVYVSNVLIGTYAFASNFKTETSGELESEGTDGSVSDIISWPRTLSGDAKDALDAVADA